MGNGRIVPDAVTLTRTLKWFIAVAVAFGLIFMLVLNGMTTAQQIYERIWH